MSKCECCGKEITKIFGSGRFCSRSCANKRNKSTQSRQKTSKSMIRYFRMKGIEGLYFDGLMNKCEVCGKDIPITSQNRDHYKSLKTCGNNQCKQLCRERNRKDLEGFKIKCRENALNRGFGGFNMHKIKYEVNGKIVDSSYEKIVAESLSENNIKWERSKRFKYHDLTGKLHYYTPDFYLPDYHIYLDPKNDYLINNVNPILGYKDVDKIKWVEQENSIKIIILDKDHLIWKQILNLL